MSPKGAELRIRTLQLVPVSSQSALLVIVTDGGIMRDSIIRVGSDMDADALYARQPHADRAPQRSYAQRGADP